MAFPREPCPSACGLCHEDLHRVCAPSSPSLTLRPASGLEGELGKHAARPGRGQGVTRKAVMPHAPAARASRCGRGPAAT